MGLSRLLIVILLVIAGVWLWRRLSRKGSQRPPAQGALPMVRCAQCGVHVPQQQALQAQGKWYCSQAHLPRGSETGGQ